MVPHTSSRRGNVPCHFPPLCSVYSPHLHRSLFFLRGCKVNLILIFWHKKKNKLHLKPPVAGGFSDGALNVSTLQSTSAKLRLFYPVNYGLARIRCAAAQFKMELLNYLIGLRARCSSAAGGGSLSWSEPRTRGFCAVLRIFCLLEQMRRQQMWRRKHKSALKGVMWSASELKAPTA